MQLAENKRCTAMVLPMDERACVRDLMGRLQSAVSSAGYADLPTQSGPFMLHLRAVHKKYHDCILNIIRDHPAAREVWLYDRLSDDIVVTVAESICFYWPRKKVCLVPVPRNKWIFRGKPPKAEPYFTRMRRFILQAILEPHMTTMIGGTWWNGKRHIACCTAEEIEDGWLGGWFQFNWAG